MSKKQSVIASREELEQELERVRHELAEANDTIDAIRTGQIDALVVQGKNGHELYTLKSADQTYRVFIEKMTEGAVTLDPNGFILYSNSQFARMVDKPLSGVIGLSMEGFIAPEWVQTYRYLFENCWKNDCKGEVFLQSGEARTPVQLSLTTLDLDEGESLSIILTDLTAQKATQAQLKSNNEQLEAINRALEASNHDLQQFASVASHDLQEPLRKIQMFSNLLLDQSEKLTDKSRRYLEKIVESSGRMKTLIFDILNYSRLSRNDLELQRVNLNDLVKELIDDFELIIQEKGARFDIGELPVLQVNPGQIRQVFQNIISNALKFSKPGGFPFITIRANRITEKSIDSKPDPNGQYSCISIQDNGIGFDEKYLENIFVLFERLNSKDKFEGTGIGLAIAKKIIEKHNGLITAHSQEGEGARFTIILPLEG